MKEYKRDSKGRFIKGTEQPHGFEKGHVSWNKDKIGIYSEEYIEKLSETHKGQIPWNTGLTKETNESLAKMAGAKEGEENPMWLGGISFEPYGKEFNIKLRNEVRERDGYICQECDATQKELGYTLHVHHIDYDKKNNEEDNLISLCRSCHIHTNANREYWTEYFTNKLIKKGDRINEQK